jgi:tRNA A-37 threonylcarbamoyl transferase component Bud32/tetratricopeptide (TPR) repeat protein
MEIAGYAIGACIAEGGMAAAYLAEQVSLGRKVVLKVLDKRLNDSPVALQRFLNEGRLLATLRHPNIITIYDIGTTDDLVYISMEYVAGGDLKQRLAQGPLDPVTALRIFEQVARGLAAAHAEGIVHRDVKPGNILFRADGTPVLSDFGIAKSLVRDADLTATGVFLGSPNYMAPEQAEAGEVDGRADIYALGVILFEMLTGLKPYPSESVIEVIHMHKKAPIPRLPGPFAALQPLLDTMLAKDREARFRDVGALLDYLGELRRRGVLRALASGGAEPPRAPPAAPPTRLRWDAPSDRRIRYALFALLGVMLAGYAGLFVIEARLARPVRAGAPGDLAELSATRAVLATPAATTAGPIDPSTVVTGLLWLGRHSLNTNRLTSPASDNAYYYFSRALQLDPTNQTAQAGIREIAKSYALLAEAAVTRGDTAQARAYLAVGRQLDPDNEALQVMTELTAPPRRGLWQMLSGWWRRAD